MKHMVIDPPSGWQYGFPKPIPEDQLGRVNAWLVENGYPQAEIDACGDHFYYRCWQHDDDEPEPVLPEGAVSVEPARYTPAQQTRKEEHEAPLISENPNNISR